MEFIEDIVEVLHTNGLRCHVCKYYLSVKPITTNYQHGETVCGRCTTSSNLFTRNHIYEVLANQFIFPCMYAKEGCTVRKPFDNIKEHENYYCSYRIYKCHCSWSGNSLELIAHYEGSHKELVIKESDPIPVAYGLNNFLLISHLYYFINCRYCTDNFNLEIISLTDNTEYEIIFAFKLFASNMDCLIETNKIMKIPCTEILPTFTLKSTVTIESLNLITKNLICPNCGIQMTPPILRCLRGHLTCLECTEAWLDFCRKCKTEIEFDFVCDLKLESLAAISIFLCRWKCGSKFNACDIRDHERGCEKRVFECCQYFHCDWSGTLKELMFHEKTYKCNLNDCLFFLNQTEIPFLIKANTHTINHLYIYNCYFDLRYSRKNLKASIHIDCKDYCAANRYRFTLRLTCPENRYCFFNKNYTFKYKNPTCFSLTIPENDMLQIGKKNPFKTVISIIELTKEERIQKTNWIKKRFKNCRRLLW